MIIPFPAKPYVAISSAMVTEIRTGTARVRYVRPILTYFLHYTEDDGFSCCVWDGCTYDGALAAARIWADEGVTVRDRTSEAGARA